VAFLINKSCAANCAINYTFLVVTTKEAASDNDGG
jgi:hypothetical protein